MKKWIGTLLLGLLLGAFWSASPAAQSVTNAIVIRSLQALGLFGTGYTAGQVPGWNATTRKFDATTPAAGGASTANTYITQTAAADLTAEQALGGLASALLVNTTTTGVLSAYAGSTCTNQAVTAISVLGAATCTTLTSAYTTGLATTAGTLAQFAATTSAQLFGVISDEVGGTGVLVGSTVATLSSLTSIGTIGTGVWQGTAVAFGFGGTGLGTAADDTVLLSTGAAWAAVAVTNCTDTGGNHLNYTTATNLFSCGTSGAAAGANTALSNLAAVAINTSLLPSGTTTDLGSTGFPFQSTYLNANVILSNSTALILKATADSTDTQTIEINGGGGAGQTRGGAIVYAGNEHGNVGGVYVYPGNVAGSEFKVINSANTNVPFRVLGSTGIVTILNVPVFSAGLGAITTTNFAATTSAQLFGVISDESGSGVVPGTISPVFTTPALGVATGATLALYGTAIPMLNVTGTATITGTGAAVRFYPTVNGLAGAAIFNLYADPTLVEAASGNHAAVGNINFEAPVIIAGAATVTDAYTLRIGGAPTATVSGANYALWVVSGRTSLDGTVFLPGISAGVAGDTDACLKVTTLEVTNAAASTCIVSSLRYKSNWQPLNAGLAEVLKLTPGSFYYTNDAKKVERIGLNAENMAVVEPRLAFYEQDGPDKGKPRGVAYEETVALLTKAIQDLTACVKAPDPRSCILALEAR